MYSWIFAHLPGSTWARVLQSLVLVGAVVAVLMLWGFPAVAPLLPFNDPAL